eukprot:TRINITY_DN79994_c0_g1_i1.p1 TRINITY_DN79994_c0_g1~~TRINITY_DN79994_c0_g1_i1.p1  ORF type:complete len:203 (+),score=42.22 TRINITY_DN79994_c0_g1_i1:71-679(+)
MHLRALAAAAANSSSSKMALMNAPRFLSIIPNRRSFISNYPSFLPLPSTPTPTPNITQTSLIKPGLICFAGHLPKATSEETATTILEKFDNVYHEERNDKEASFDARAEAIEILDKLKMKLDLVDPYPVLVYGSGALAALWISAAIVGALDSIPLLPKLLEVVGLGFTVWFSYRYVIFKKDRKELSENFQKIKQEIIGSNED